MSRAAISLIVPVLLIALWGGKTIVNYGWGLSSISTPALFMA